MISIFTTDRILFLSLAPCDDLSSIYFRWFGRIWKSMSMRNVNMGIGQLNQYEYAFNIHYTTHATHHTFECVILYEWNIGFIHRCESNNILVLFYSFLEWEPISSFPSSASMGDTIFCPSVSFTHSLIHLLPFYELKFFQYKAALQFASCSIRICAIQLIPIGERALHYYLSINVILYLCKCVYVYLVPDACHIHSVSRIVDHCAQHSTS